MVALYKIIAIFNPRELALLFWGFIIFGWMLTNKEVRVRLRELLKAIVNAWIFFLVMLSYITICVILLSKISLWDTTLLKTTIVWILGWAVMMITYVNKVTDQKGYLKESVVDLIKFSVFLSFIVDFYTFSFGIELFLLPILIIIISVSEFSKTQIQYYNVYRLLNPLVIAAGLLMVSYSIYQALVNFQEFASVGTGKEFLLPIILSFMYLPFIYALSQYLKYMSRKSIKKFAESKRRKAL